MYVGKWGDNGWTIGFGMTGTVFEIYLGKHILCFGSKEDKQTAEMSLNMKSDNC